MDRHIFPEHNEKGNKIIQSLTMTSLAAIQEKCSQVDLEIKSRQSEFGEDFFNLLQRHYEEASSEKEDLTSPDLAFLSSIKEQWNQASEEMEQYIEKHNQRAGKSNKNNKSNKKKKGGYMNMASPSAIVDQWILQRKQKFGVDCFDTAFEVLGTGSNGNGGIAVSTLSPQEKEIHKLIQDAVADVVLLERMKDSYLQELQVTHEGGLIPFFCGAAMCC